MLNKLYTQAPGSMSIEILFELANAHMGAGDEARVENSLRKAVRFTSDNINNPKVVTPDDYAETRYGVFAVYIAVPHRLMCVSCGCVHASQ